MAVVTRGGTITVALLTLVNGAIPAISQISLGASKEKCQRLFHKLIIEDRPRTASAATAIESAMGPVIDGPQLDRGIPTAVHYPRPLHLQEAFADLGQGVGSFAVSEAVSERIISLPMSPFLAESDQDQVIDAVRQAVGA